NIVEALQSEGDFTNVRISRTLTHAVDGSLNPRRSSTHARHPTCRRHAEIIMPMPVQGNFRTDPTSDLTDQELSGLRPAGAKGVHNNDFGRASLECGQINCLQKIEFRARPVHSEISDFDAGLLGERNRVHHATEYFV